MKTLTFVYYEGEHGEAQGVFDDSGELLDFWAGNDGDFRVEYFRPFMKKLGFNVVSSHDDVLLEKLEAEIEKSQ